MPHEFPTNQTGTLSDENFNNQNIYTFLNTHILFSVIIKSKFKGTLKLSVMFAAPEIMKVTHTCLFQNIFSI